MLLCPSLLIKEDPSMMYSRFHGAVVLSLSALAECLCDGRNHDQQRIDASRIGEWIDESSRHASVRLPPVLPEPHSIRGTAGTRMIAEESCKRDKHSAKPLRVTPQRRVGTAPRPVLPAIV